MSTRIVMVAVLGWLLCWGTGWSAEKKETAKNPDRDKPITITSDRMEAFNEKRLVVFSGNAVAVQGERVLRANTLSLYYRKENEGGSATPKSDSDDFAKTGSVERIEADGNVRITQEKKIVTGDHAVYYQDTQKIVMTGNAVMKDGNNVIRGDKVDVFLDENRGVVEGSGSKRVTATIYPGGEKEKKEGK